MHTVRSIGGYRIPRSVKCTHSATKCLHLPLSAQGTQPPPALRGPSVSRSRRSRPGRMHPAAPVELARTSMLREGSEAHPKAPSVSLRFPRYLTLQKSLPSLKSPRACSSGDELVVMMMIVMLIYNEFCSCCCYTLVVSLPGTLEISDKPPMQLPEAPLSPQRRGLRASLDCTLAS